MIRLMTFALALLLSSVVTAAAQTEGANPPESGHGGDVSIVGHVMSVDSEGNTFPLSIYSGWVRYMHLIKFSQETQSYDIWVNGVNCEAEQGCPERFGRFRYSQYYSGEPLGPGKYKIVVNVLGHDDIIIYQKFLPGETEVKAEAKMSPVFLGFVRNSSEVLPKNGGTLAADVYVCNLDTRRPTVPVYAWVSGPTSKRAFAQYQELIAEVQVPEERFACTEVFTLGRYFGEELPNFESYGVKFSIGEPSETMADEIWVEAKKGAKIEVREPPSIIK